MESAIRNVTLTIDGKEVSVAEGTTILDAARQNNITIPTLCHHPALSSWGGCRICVVQVDGSPRLVASCVMPVRDGMDVVTNNEAITQSRRLILEFLFAERNHNCMFCAQSGDCELQKLAYELQMDHLTVSFSFNKFSTDTTSEYLAIDHNRCILCGRCIRACREIAGAYVLNFQNRGPQSLIGFDLAERRDESGCDNSGVCMQVCPTGAIYSRYRAHYAVKGHGNDWECKESVCSQCGLLCPTKLFIKNNVLLKVEGHLGNESERPDRGQLCYKGRFEVLKSKGPRLLEPMVKNAQGVWQPASWEEAIKLTTDALTKIRKEHGSPSIFGITSSASSHEDLISFRELMVEGLDDGYCDTLDGSSFRSLAAARAKIGRGYEEASWKAVSDADLIMIIGVDPHERQPVIASLTRKNMLENRTGAVVVAPRDTMQPWTTFLPAADAEIVQGISHAFLCAALAAKPPASTVDNLKKIKEIAAKGDVATILSQVGYDADLRTVFDDAVAAFVKAENPLVITGCDQGKDGWLPYAFSLALLKGPLPDKKLRLVMLKESGNSAAAWKLHLAAHTPGDNRLWKGGLLALNGEDAVPWHLFNGLESFTVCTPYCSDIIKEHAQVLLPKPLWSEEQGTYSSLDGTQAKYKKRILIPPEGVLQSWKIWSAMLEKISGTSPFARWEDLAMKAEDELKQ